MAGTGLTRKQEQAIAALLSERTVAAAAGTAGVAYRTLKLWLQKPAFQAAYAAARQAVLDRTVSRLLSITGKAVETLERNLDCNIPAVEIRAAGAILEQAVKGVELSDLVLRLEELERRHTPEGGAS